MTATNTKTEEATLPRFVVMTSAASMPSSCRGTYRNVAVVELEPGQTRLPRMITKRARGVVRIVKRYGPRNVGKTDRCDYKQTLRVAQELADELNGTNADQGAKR